VIGLCAFDSCDDVAFFDASWCRRHEQGRDFAPGDRVRTIWGSGRIRDVIKNEVIELLLDNGQSKMVMFQYATHITLDVDPSTSSGNESQSRSFSSLDEELTFLANYRRSNELNIEKLRALLVQVLKYPQSEVEVVLRLLTTGKRETVRISSEVVDAGIESLWSGWRPSLGREANPEDIECRLRSLVGREFVFRWLGPNERRVIDVEGLSENDSGRVVSMFFLIRQVGWEPRARYYVTDRYTGITRDCYGFVVDSQGVSSIERDEERREEQTEAMASDYFSRPRGLGLLWLAENLFDRK
jgi:hypothetical protein